MQWPQNQVFCEQKRLTEYKNRRNLNCCRYPEYQEFPQAKKRVKRQCFSSVEYKVKIVSKKTQTPCTGLSLALRSTSEKDLFPSAILKEISAMKDAGLLLISMPVHTNEKLLLQVIFFISKCIYSCQIPHLHPAFWPSSAFTGPNQEENNQYFQCNSICFRVSLSSTFLTLHCCWVRLLLFQHLSFGFNHFIHNSSPTSVHFLIFLSSPYS